MYHRLDARLSIGSGYLRTAGNYDEALVDGALVDTNTLDLPWPYTWRVKAGTTFRPSDFYPGAKLMSARLVETLRSCGVDNLQTFPPAIVDASGRTMDGFLVVNVLGLVAAANLGASRGRPLADATYFEHLVIDPVKARGLLMFRLAESRNDLIIAEDVAAKVREGNFVDVTVEPLETAASP